MKQFELKPLMLVSLSNVPDAKVYRIRQRLPKDGMVELETYKTETGWRAVGPAHVAGLRLPTPAELKIYMRQRFSGTFA